MPYASRLFDYNIVLQGEGELKMVARLHAPWPASSVPGDSHLLVGSDADFTLMAMLAGRPHAASTVHVVAVNSTSHMSKPGSHPQTRQLDRT